MATARLILSLLTIGLSRARVEESPRRVLSQNQSQVFVNLARLPIATPACSAARWGRVLELVHHLGAAAHEISAKFRDEGFWGVFGSQYHGAKVNFMWNAICNDEQLANKSSLQVCEIGFNAGQSAVLFLESGRETRVLSFDLGDYPWNKKQASTVKAAYGERFDIIFGNSLETVQNFVAKNKDFKCDVAFIDGAKTRQIRNQDLKNIRRLSTVGDTLLLFDEATTMECMNQGDCQSTRQNHYSWGGATLAYYDAVSSGLMKILDCAWPVGMEGADGVCKARYAK